MKRSYRILIGVIALALILVVLLPADSGLGIKLRGYLQTEDQDPEVITVTTAQPPVTITETYTPSPVTATQQVTEVIGVSFGYLEITGAVGWYDTNEKVISGQLFSSPPDPADYTGESTHLKSMRVTFTRITVHGNYLNPDTLRVSLYLKLDLPEPVTLWHPADSFYPRHFEIKGNEEAFTATLEYGADVWIDLLTEARAANFKDYTNDGAEWPFRLKAKLSIETPRGTDLYAYAEKRYHLYTNWCTTCGGTLEYRGTQAIESNNDIIWTGGKVGLLSTASPSVFGVPVWLIGVIVIVFGYRYYKNKEQ